MSSKGSVEITREMNTLGSIFLSLGAGLLVIVCCFGGLRFWNSHGAIILPSGSTGLSVGAALALTGILAGRLRGKRISFDGRGFAILLLLVFLSDIPARRWMLFTGPQVRGDIFLWSLVGLLLFWKGKGSSSIPFLALLASIALIWSFMHTAGGRILFSDDHATFLYRLSLLHDVFPSIPNYYPMWNAGIEVRDYFPSGVGGLYVLALPLLVFFDAREVYNVLIAGVLFVLAPFAVASVVRLLNGNKVSAAIAFLLALSSSLIWYRWSLKYGTMGFVIASALVPLNLFLSAKILSPDKQIKKREAVLFVFSVTLMCLWPLVTIVFVPVYLLGILFFRRAFRKRYVPWILVALIALNAPWMGTFFAVSKVSKFLVMEEVADPDGVDSVPMRQHAADGEEHWSKQGQAVVKAHHHGDGAVTRFQQAFSAANILLLLFALPGVLLISNSFIRAVFLLEIVWLLLLGTVLASLKPQLELDRMFVIVQLLCVVPAALSLQELFARVSQGTRSTTGSLSAALSFGFLVSGVLCAVSISQNRSDERFSFQSALFRELSSVISKYGGEGRVFFSGFVLHDVGSSHIAPLTLFTEQPLVASDPIHRFWQRVDAVPELYRKGGEQGIEEYLDLLNVTAVIAHEKKWIRYFQQRQKRYSVAWNKGKFHLFKREGVEPNYFLEGSGKIVRQTSRSVVIIPETPSAVIKFNYLPFLKSDNCSISAEPVSSELSLVRLSQCVTGEVTNIRARSVYERFIRN